MRRSNRHDKLAASQQKRQIMNETVRTHWPNGHYYSPVVKPDQATKSYWLKEIDTNPEAIHGIDLDLVDMIEFWRSNSDYFFANTFPDAPNGLTRFHNENGSFPGGDAVFLGAMMRKHRPKSIIEVGSGNSTACMLDWAERTALSGLRLTCIEPDPIRLKERLRPGDTVKIISQNVQDVPLTVFSELDEGDILFIDSTHILKTGSDVHYELFHVLPALRSGVIIHFHDCAYPFEYPKEAVFDMNFSWNEAYALRGFLMYNSAFKVVFWNSMFYRFCPPEMRAEFSTRLSSNPGGGIWIKKL